MSRLINPAVELNKIKKSYEAKQVLADFNLTVPMGAKLALVGESSSGKSTLLKIIVGLVRPDSGTVKVFGKNINEVSGNDIRSLRQRIGMQFQSGALFDSLSVIENLNLARWECARNEEQRLKAQDPAEAMSLLAAVGLSKAADKAPHALSGGMRKRVAIARAIITNPDLAIFDEPTAGLDPVTSSRIINLIKNVSTQSGAAMILATTDVQVARHFSNDLLVINEGSLWARGSVESLRDSGDPFVLKLLSRLL